MPRTSAAALSIAPLTPRRPRGVRLATPRDLTQAEADVWLDTVNALPADWFTPEQAHVLAAYCRAAARLAEIEKALGKVKLRDAVNYDRLARLARQESASFLRFARALRLTPQARLKATTAGRRAGTGGLPDVDFTRLEEEE